MFPWIASTESVLLFFCLDSLAAADQAGRSRIVSPMRAVKPGLFVKVKYE
jgi:hypothetical protein